ncbi:MAG: hypothetical protein CFH43_00019 [Proteobacteria bacterium]|nr:MAG: hypothetical protein CFH43_00019 [Pseudomonadota bacterium]
MASIWTDAGDYIHYDDFRIYKTGTTIDVPSNFKGFIYDESKSALRIGQDPFGNFDDGQIGDYSFAMGRDTQATANGTFAFGTYARATQTSNVALGSGSRSDGSFSFALGNFGDVNSGIPTDSNTGSINTRASGAHSMALQRAWATGDYSLAAMRGAYATGTQAIAIGHRAEARNGATVALGPLSNATGYGGVALGRYANSTASYAVALTPNSNANATRSVAIGQNATVSGLNSMVIGLSDVTGTNVTDTNTLAVIGGQMAVNQVSANAELDVSGTVSATAFVGDGSQLTGVTASSVTLALGDLTDAADDGSSIFIGSGAGAADDGTSNANLAIGRNAMGNSVTRNSSVAIGHDALLNGTDRSVAIGGGAGTSLGFDSVAIGHYAGQSASTHVVAIGRNSGTNAGGGSVVIGEGAGSSVGSGAVAIGRNAGDNIGNYSIAIGENAASAQTAGEYNIVIGRDAQLVDLAGSNQLNIGDAIYGSNLYTTGQSIIGINTTSATESLEVSGTVSATAFVGDGSGLTGLAASLAELTDVSSSMAPSANQLLGYNGSTSEWEPVDPSAAGLWTDAGDYIMRGSARFYDDTTATIDFPNSTRGFFFHEGRGALRAGQSYFAEWDDADVGSLSVGFGNVGRLSGSESFGVGDGVRVTANDGIAMGYRASVTGNQGVAIGSNSTAATLAYAIGNSNSAAGYDYLIGGSNTSTGSGTKAAFGTGNTLLSHRSYAYGANNNVEGYTSGTPTADTQGYNYAFGTNNQVTALNHAIAIGTGMTIAGNNSMGIGVGYSASGSVVADDNTLAIMGASGGVGIGTVSPNAELEVSGTVSATAFVGDGSQLTGLADASSIILNDTSISIIDDNSNTAILAFDVDGARVMEYNVDQVPGFKFRENSSRGIFVSDESNDLLLGSLLASNGYKAGVVRVGGDGDNSNVYADANSLRLGTKRTNNNYAEDIFFETIVRDWSRVNMMIDGSNGRIGMGTETPSTKLDVSGTVTATAFVGDGSGLTGVGGLWTDAGDYIVRDGFRVYVSGTTIDLNNDDRVAFFDEEKGAFRAGRVNYGDWDEANIGNFSTAFGRAAASGGTSFAWGAPSGSGNTVAAGSGDLALGFGAKTNSSNSWKMAIGVNAEATNSPGNTAFGPGAKALGGTGYYAAFAVGPGAIAESGEQVFALGYGAKANTGFRNIAVGHGVETSGSRSSVFGYGGTVSGDDSMMLSVGADASGTEITDTNTLAIMGATGGVGIGIVSPSAELEVLGTVSATAFVGDGSSLTNVLAMPAGNDGRLQFNNSGVMDGAPLAYNTTYDKFYARGGLNNYIVNHSTGGTYAGRMNIGTADPSTEEGVLHLAVAGYNNTADLKRMLGVVMIGNRDSVFDTTPIPILEGSYLPGIGFAGHTTTSLGAETEMGATVHAVIDGTVSSGVLPTAIVVNTGTNSGNLQERLRISSDGYIGIGTVSPSSELEVSGTVKATEFVASSDRSLKENIKPLESALENVLNLKGVSYNFKPETGLTQAPQIGLVAQEVKEVYPQVVNGEEGHMSVNYPALVSPLIEAVKELNAKVDQQQTIIEKQQKLIDALMEKK